MRPILLITLTLGSALAVSGSAAVFAQPIAGSVTGLPSAPIGHLQPRAQRFSSRSEAEQIEQQKMSVFNAEQQNLDKQLDKRLSICRC